MTIEAIEDGVKVNIYKLGNAQTGTFQVKLNDGAWTDVSWEDIGSGKDVDLVKAADSSKSSMSAGDKLKFRNIGKWSSSDSQVAFLKVTGAKAKVYGKLAESLTPEFVASAQDYKLAYFFGGSTVLKDASGLDLVGITLASKCYYNMFNSCTSLVNAPKLPTTTLANGCYIDMFYGCKSLVSAPELPATTLASNCYNSMFASCTSLVNAPELPATTLASDCYSSMFYKCTSLVNAPELSATTLANYCYRNMFSNCTKISELHYPASIKSNGTFTSMEGSPKFGATIDDSKIFYDL